MRCYLLPLLFLACIFDAGLLTAQEPVFDAIDYSSPETCLELAESLGDSKAIRTLATSLKGTSQKKTVTNILQWMESSLRYDDKLAYKWRNFDSVTSDKCYGGCADYAIACGALLQSSSIPTVWVKTMDVDWIRKFKKDGPPDVWSGHVFLEIYLDGKWVLLDPGAALVYENYETESRILPGNRVAYHKGCDPKQMVMSLQWEPWKEQTKAYFEKFDAGLLPVDTRSAVSLRPKWNMIANAPYYQVFGQLIKRKGKNEGRSFNTKYDENITRIKGQTLLIQTHGGIPIVDVDILKRHFPDLPDGKLEGKMTQEDTTLFFIDVDALEDLFVEAAAEKIPAQGKWNMIANSPYYQVLGELIRRKGKTEGSSFNTNYDEIIKRIKGETLLIQTHAGIPIVDVDILKQHFPGLPDGKLEGKMTQEDTNLFFVDVDALENIFNE